MIDEKEKAKEEYNKEGAAQIEKAKRNQVSKAEDNE